jgi:hypothetical protein
MQRVAGILYGSFGLVTSVRNKHHALRCNPDCRVHTTTVAQDMAPERSLSPRVVGDDHALLVRCRDRLQQRKTMTQFYAISGVVLSVESRVFSVLL